MKKKILIIEDEYFFRQVLKKYISQYPEEFEVVGEANNGKAGLEQLALLTPDIALVDITMPIMNGIEVIREAASRGYQTKMVILTGYSEFEYAKEAIQLGVQDYLLKPLQIDDLYRSLKKAALELDRDWFLRDAQTFAFAETDVTTVIHNRLIEKMFFSPLAPSDVQDIGNRLSLPEYGFYALILIDLSVTHSEVWREEDRKICNYAICNMLSEILPEPFQLYRQAMENHFLSVLCYSPASDTENNKKVLSATLEKLGALVDQHLALPIIISVGSFCDSIHEIKNANEEALHLQKSHFFNDQYNIYYFGEQDANHYQYSRAYFSEEDSRQLGAFIRSGDLERSGGLVKEVFHRLATASVPAHTIYFCVSELFASVLKEAAEHNIQLSFDNADPSFYSHLFASKSLDELEWFIMENIRTLLHSVNAKDGQDEQKRLALEIALYVDTHFGDCQISLETIAGAFFISVKYMCFLFKKHMSVTVGNYLFDTRMRHAKHLMENGAENIAAIAKKCGYEDPNYFSKCFKKYFGVSPRRYFETTR